MIVDNELLGIGAVKDADDGDNFAHLYPTVPIFTWMENSIQKNLSEIGDSTWMVMFNIISLKEFHHIMWSCTD